MVTKRTAGLYSVDPVDDRARARRRVAAYLDGAVEASDRPLRALAACAGVSEAKLRAVRRGDHSCGLELVRVLPTDTRDRLMSDFAAEVGRQWIEDVDPGAGEEWIGMLDQLRDSFEAAWRELRSIGRTGRITADAAAKARPHVRRARRLLATVDSLLERALEERVVSVAGEGEERE